MDQPERQSHWDDRYRTSGADSVSWFEAEPRLSLELFDLVGATPASSVIDIGGGASSLTATLQQRGFADLTVLDVSAEALDASRRNVDSPDEITWIRADLLDWSPARRWNV
ncbi:class I SAM-dependent methyltransferase [Candidatus Microthrix sp.]|nr:methyltransferase domain-containing protein [Candidatus Microthrix sp.]HMS49293.1 methyltransferase domain-containing protein [Candidatus Microthrix sp.]